MNKINYDSYVNTKRKIFYWFTGFAVFCSIVFIIPNLSNDLNDYTKSVETFKSAKINVTERRKGFTIINEYELIVTMQNDREWKFGDQYEKYWKEIGDSSNVGKKITIYTKGFIDSNPSQVEIENKVVYDLTTLNSSKYLCLVTTVILLIISINDYRKRKVI